VGASADTCCGCSPKSSNGRHAEDMPNAPNVEALADGAEAAEYGPDAEEAEALEVAKVPDVARRGATGCMGAEIDDEAGGDPRLGCLDNVPPKMSLVRESASISKESISVMGRREIEEEEEGTGTVAAAGADTAVGCERTGGWAGTGFESGFEAGGVGLADGGL